MLKTFLLPVLRGCGQMLFQPSARTGTVFLALIVWQSTSALLMCLAGVLGATLIAYVMEHPDRVYFEGEGGFNGGLLGLALSAFCEYSGELLLVGFAGGAAAGLVRFALLRLLPVPPFTAPFIIAAWPAFLACGALPDPAALEPASTGVWHGIAPATSASQVLFLVEPWTGVLVFAAVWLHSARAALWIAGASLVAWLTAVLFDLPDGLIAAGMLGYNGLILAAALQHRATRLSLFTGGVALSVGLTYWFLQSGTTPLSAPFVLSAWLVIAVERGLARRARAPGE